MFDIKKESKKKQARLFLSLGAAQDATAAHPALVLRPTLCATAPHTPLQLQPLTSPSGCPPFALQPPPLQPPPLLLCTVLRSTIASHATVSPRLGFALLCVRFAWSRVSPDLAHLFSPVPPRGVTGATHGTGSAHAEHRGLLEPCGFLARRRLFGAPPPSTLRGSPRPDARFGGNVAALLFNREGQTAIPHVGQTLASAAAAAAQVRCRVGPGGPTGAGGASRRRLGSARRAGWAPACPRTPAAVAPRLTPSRAWPGRNRPI